MFCKVAEVPWVAARTCLVMGWPAISILNEPVSLLPNEEGSDN